jgi:hypothetical protein
LFREVDAFAKGRFEFCNATVGHVDAVEMAVKWIIEATQALSERNSEQTQSQRNKSRWTRFYLMPWTLLWQDRFGVRGAGVDPAARTLEGTDRAYP